MDGRLAVGLVQFDQRWEDKEGNKRKITELLKRLPGRKAINWLLFPEMTLSGFSLNAVKTSIDEEDVEFFREIAKRHRSAVTFGGVTDGKNRSLTIDHGGELLADFAKLHLFSFAGENESYAPGRESTSFVLSGFRVTPAICYDLRFPYVFWDRAARTDIYAIIANWPEPRISHWRRLLAARAIENQAYVVGVNRIGKDPNAPYSGDSMVVDPLGNVVLDCGAEEGVFVAEIDAETVAKTRRQFPFMKDRKE